MTEPGWVEVEQRLGELAASGALSGSVLVTRGEEVLLETCHGWADRAHDQRIHPGTRFGLASMSKMFTAAAVLDAVRREEVAVGDRVVDVLPPERRPATMAEEVTVHHLLTHTSGIGDYAEEDEDLPHHVADYGSLWVDRPCYRMERPDDFLPMYSDLSPVGPPGGDFHYCNAGYVLLGALLEQVTGQPFVEAVTRRVLEPAGMSDTGYFRSDEAVRDVAVGYLPRSGDDAPWRTNVFSVPVVGGGDGGALATARDIDRFLRAVKDGSLLGEETTGLMLTPYVPIQDGLDMGYGVMLRAGGTTISHGGGDPGVIVLARHVGALDLTLVLLTNVEDEEGFDRAWEALESGVGATTP